MSLILDLSSNLSKFYFFSSQALSSYSHFFFSLIENKILKKKHFSQILEQVNLSSVFFIFFYAKY